MIHPELRHSEYWKWNPGKFRTILLRSLKFRKIVSTTRITSYNVCYTKLLRTQIYEAYKDDRRTQIVKEEALAFYNELINAESAPLKEFEKEQFKVYEGCMPVEVLAKRGEDTMRFGPLKPVGLTDPRTGKRPYAVVQLRKENNDGTLYNLVGFQTNLKFGEQKRVFSLITGLENAVV